MKRLKKIKPHRYLFNKIGLVQKATAAVALYPADECRVEYLKGLCDALHGTTEGPLAKAIHMARQVIIAAKV